MKSSKIKGEEIFPRGTLIARSANFCQQQNGLMEEIKLCLKEGVREKAVFKRRGKKYFPDSATFLVRPADGRDSGQK